MDKPYFPKITASDIKEFAEIEKQVKRIPLVILGQIESVESGLVGLTCISKKFYSSDEKIFLPKSTRQITDFGDYIGVYTEGFFFKLYFYDNKVRGPKTYIMEHDYIESK